MLGEALVGPVDLTLGERPESRDVEATGERLRRAGQARIAGRAGEDETARSKVAIQLSLDRIEDRRNVLVLVDEDRRVRGCEGRRAGVDRVARQGVVEIDYRAPS